MHSPGRKSGHSSTSIEPYSTKEEEAWKNYSPSKRKTTSKDSSISNCNRNTTCAKMKRHRTVSTTTTSCKKPKRWKRKKNYKNSRSLSWVSKCRKTTNASSSPTVTPNSMITEKSTTSISASNQLNKNKKGQNKLERMLFNPSKNNFRLKMQREEHKKNWISSNSRKTNNIKNNSSTASIARKGTNKMRKCTTTTDSFINKKWERTNNWSINL